MNFIIHWLSQVIARTLERGSGVGAFVGALIGLVAGVSTPYFLQQRGMIDSMIIPAVALSIALVIVGALVGSGIGPRPLGDAEVVPGGSVKLTNFNRGLVPSFFLAISTAVFLLTVLRAPKSESDLQTVIVIRVVLGIAAAVSIFFQLRTILWIEIGPLIVVRQLLTRKTYRTEEIRDAGFEVSRGRYVLERLPRDARFVIRFTDGCTYSLGAAAYKTGAVAAILNPAIQAHRAARRP